MTESFQCVIVQVHKRRNDSFVFEAVEINGEPMVMACNENVVCPDVFNGMIAAQWGDEGKGKITNILVENADVCVRSQGGGRTQAIQSS